MLICFKWASIVIALFVAWILAESFLFNVNLIEFKENDISFYGLIFPFAFPGIYFGLKEIRRHNDYGFLTFSEGIRYGFLIAFFICTLSSIFIFFYYDFFYKYLYQTPLRTLDEFYFNPFVQSFYQFGYSLAACIISIFISAAMVKNTNKKIVDFT